MRLTRKDILIILGAFILLLIFGAGSWLLLGEGAVMVVLILSSMLILTAVFEFYRRLVNDTQKLKRHYQRIEALFSLFYIDSSGEES